MSESVVQAQALRRLFGTAAAVDGVDLDLEAGQVLALLGPNGAGKTTLLRLLRGLLEPTAGQARLLGAPARHLPTEIECRIGYVGDRDEPAGWATLDLLMGLQADAVPTFDDDVCRQLFIDADLTASTRFGSLSKGQRRWVLIALALACRPAVLMLDEPADGLDPNRRRRLFDLVRDLANDHSTAAVVATHIISDIERIADEVAIIAHGKLRYRDDLETIREELREVVLPAGEAPPADVVAGRPDGDDIAWIVRADTGAPVDLETLYLALTALPAVPEAEQ